MVYFAPTVISASTNLPSSVSPSSAVRKDLPPSACAAVLTPSTLGATRT